MTELQRLGLAFLVWLILVGGTMSLMIVIDRTWQYAHDRHDQLDRIERKLERLEHAQENRP